MTPDVEHSDRSQEPKDRFHPEFESFSEWLDTVAPATNDAVKQRNSKWAGANNAVRLRDLVNRRQP